MNEPAPLDPGEALAEAIALFDAGNHAWGRFYQNLYLPYHGSPARPSAAAVRAALQEAAISVPVTGEPTAVEEFASAVAGVYEALDAFLAAAPVDLRAGDVLTAPESFRQCLAYLLPLLRGE